jgi:hypothetical protein
MRPHSVIELGLYKHRELVLFVDVIGQDINTGMVRMRLFGNRDRAKAIEYISAPLFLILFQQLETESIELRPILEA